MKCGSWVWTGSFTKLILQHKQRSKRNCWRVCDQLSCQKWTHNPDHWATFHQRQRPILGVPAQAQGRGLYFFSTYRVLMRPQGEEVANIPISTGEGACSMLTALQTFPGVILSTPVLLTHRGVLLTHTSPHTASATTYFISGVKSVCRTAKTDTIIGSILGLVVRETTGRVRLLNKFCSNSC